MLAKQPFVCILVNPESISMAWLMSACGLLGIALRTFGFLWPNQLIFSSLAGTLFDIICLRLCQNKIRKYERATFLNSSTKKSVRSGTCFNLFYSLKPLCQKMCTNGPFFKDLYSLLQGSFICLFVSRILLIFITVKSIS